MSEEQVEQNLEKKFIEDTSTLFEKEDLSTIEEINRTINVISSNIMLILRTPLSLEQKQDMLLDLADFVPSKFKNNSQFSNLLDKYISEKTKSIQESTKKNTETLSNKSFESIWIDENKEVVEDTIDDKIENILDYSQKIQENILTLRNYKEDIKWMGEVLCPKILNIAKKLLDDVKNWLENQLPEIDLSTKTITNKLILIEMERWTLNLTQEQENNIYDSEWAYLTDELIKEVKTLIQEIKQSIAIYEGQIKQVLLVKMSTDIAENETDEEDSRENLFIQEMLVLFDESYAKRIFSTIGHMYSWVEDIINSDLSHSEKIKVFEDPLKAFNPAFLDNNQRAIDLLKVLIDIKIQKYIISADKDIYSMSYTIPKKIHISVMLLLNGIVKKYLGNEINSETKKIIIKKKCDLFIEELNKVMPNLLQVIVDRKGVDVFKVREINPILRKLKIPEIFHKDFIKIVDLYYREKRESIDSENKAETQPDILDFLYSDLKKDLMDCPESILGYCEKFIVYFQINLPHEVSKDIIDKIIEEKNKLESSNNWVLGIVRKMWNINSWASLINNSPYDEILKKASLPKWKTNEPQLPGLHRRDNLIPKSQTRVEEITNHFLGIFPHIPANIKAKLKPFVEKYYQHEISEALRKYHITRKIFSEIKEK